MSAKRDVLDRCEPCRWFGKMCDGACNFNGLQRRIAELVAEHNSYRAAGKALKLSPPYLCRLFLGQATNPTDEVLAKLGLVRIVTYKKVQHVQKS